MTDIDEPQHPDATIQQHMMPRRVCAHCGKLHDYAGYHCSLDCWHASADASLSSEPRRVQLSRAKGWRMPENTVKVDRSTKWGNPFAPGKEGPMGRTPIDKAGAVGFFRELFRDEQLRQAAGYPHAMEVQRELRGKNLACWCSCSPCHADVLLEIANAPF